MNKGFDDNRGYTLTEIIVVISIIALISGAVALTVHTVVMQSITNRAWSLVVGEVNETGRWISRDVQSAMQVNAWSPTTWQCEVKRYQWNGTGMDNITVAYVIEGGNIYRLINGEAEGMLVAKFIDATGTNFTKIESENITAYKLKVRAAYDEVSYEKEYQIYQRTIR